MKEQTIKNTFDAVIIGGGAAGLMVAIEASKNQKKVLLIEHNRNVGNKILISGGGRCNFTNINAKIENYISENVNYMRSAFSNYTPYNFIDLVEYHNIEYYEKTLGQLFCQNSSKEIIDMLINEIDRKYVKIMTETKVANLESKGDYYQLDIQSTKNPEITETVFAEKVVISCGGLSFPNRGATDFGYKIAKQFGHRITNLKPGLVPITVDKNDLGNLIEMSGISFDSKAFIKSKQLNKSFTEKIFTEKTLITHRGLSGPAILQISSFLDLGQNSQNSSFYLTINTDKKIENQLQDYRKSNKELKSVLSELVPQRFAEFVVNYLDCNKTLAQCSNKDIEKVVNFFNNWQIFPIGTEGYIKAEVTVGGVDTNELNQKTMESKISKGLYFVGEVVDITGWLGGYNFQWAWASGYACGKDI